MQSVSYNVAQQFIIDLGQPMLGSWRDYKAPHAYRGTPAKPHSARSRKRRGLFKGHRP